MRINAGSLILIHITLSGSEKRTLPEVHIKIRRAASEMLGAQP